MVDARVIPGVYADPKQSYFGVKPGDVLAFKGYPDGTGKGELARVYEIRVEYPKSDVDVGFRVQMRPNVTVRVQWLKEWGQPREDYSFMRGLILAFRKHARIAVQWVYTDMWMVGK